MLQGINNTKIFNAQQTKVIYSCKNTKEQLKMNAAICCNEICYIFVSSSFLKK